MSRKFQQLSMVALAIIILSPIDVLGQNFFTMGSSASEVRTVQGQPDDINRYASLGHEVWNYGRSRVEISTRSGRVLQWTNRGNLKVRYLPGSQVTASRTFTEGSHKDDVLRLQGTPDQISKYPSLGHEVWTFGRSRVEISTRNNQVIQWTDRGNLKAGLQPGNNVTTSRTFTEGSHKDDVLRLQGTPDQISKYPSLGHEVWTYGRSRIEISTRNNRVLQWTDRGNLKVGLQPGNDVTTSRTFTEGSHKDDVLRLQGTPDQISKYPSLGHEVWTFGRSRVEISTTNNRVLQWTDRGNLKVGLQPGINVTTSRTFTEGSHKDDVIRLQGTPEQISKYPSLGHEVWTYGRSRVEISTRSNRVLQWNNRGNLKVSMSPGTNITDSNQFKRGSHKDDVLRLQGTPDQISRYPALGYETWTYGRNRVEISIVEDIVLDYKNSGQLFAEEGQDSFQRKITYHNNLDDVTLFYDENKSFSNVFSVKVENDEVIYGVIDEGVAYLYDNQFEPLDMYAYYSDSEQLEISSRGSGFTKYNVNKISNSISSINFSGSVSGTGTAMDLGNMTFYDIMTDNGTYIHGTSMDFNNLSFDDFYSSQGTSLSGSRMRIGNFEFGDWRSSDGVNVSGTSHRIGDMIFHDYTTSDGRTVTGTTMEIGNFSFTDYYEW